MRLTNARPPSAPDRRETVHRVNPAAWTYQGNDTYFRATQERSDESVRGEAPRSRAHLTIITLNSWTPISCRRVCISRTKSAGVFAMRILIRTLGYFKENNSEMRITQHNSKYRSISTNTDADTYQSYFCKMIDINHAQEESVSHNNNDEYWQCIQGSSSPSGSSAIWQ